MVAQRISPHQLGKTGGNLPRWVGEIFLNSSKAEGEVAKDTKQPILVGNN